MRGKNNNNKGIEERERIDKISSQYNILIQKIQLLLAKNFFLSFRVTVGA